jgi:hypothetical protein
MSDWYAGCAFRTPAVSVAWKYDREKPVSKECKDAR